MGKVLILMSGKGGSGKTSFALSISKLLAKCEKKVLLIDCDMSTHGATYFFERKLSDDIVDTYNFLFSSSKNTEGSKIKALQNVDFIPSVVSVDQEYILQEPQDYSKAEKVLEKCRSIYDAIILDCQAGYSVLTKHLLSYSDVSLFVLEDDAVSNAAIRVMYKKLDSEFARHTLRKFQVLNKAEPGTAELQLENKKIGTIFDELEPIPFDWSVRKAFRERMIPLIDTENAAFTSGICQLTRMLFPIFFDPIKTYEIDVKRDYLKLKSSEYDSKKIKVQLLSAAAILLIAWLLFLLIFALKFANNSFVVENLFWVFALFGTFVMVLIGFLNSERIRYNILLKERKELEVNIDKLENEIKQLSEWD